MTFSQKKFTPTEKEETRKRVSFPDFNPKHYYADIADLKLSQAEADELLTCLCQIMCTMVEIGWGVEAVQLALPALYQSTAIKPCANDNAMQA